MISLNQCVNKFVQVLLYVLYIRCGKLDFNKSIFLFINLVDDFNDMTGFTGSPNDQVTGYTLANFLRESFGLSTLSAQLKTHRPAGVTEAQIDLLLSFY